MPKEDNFISEKDPELVENVPEEWRGRTQITNEFVVSGKSRTGALLDVPRPIVRRAGRTSVAVGYADEHPHAVRTVNRLSDCSSSSPAMPAATANSPETLELEECLVSPVANLPVTNLASATDSEGQAQIAAGREDGVLRIWPLTQGMITGVEAL